ncbi:hypothetical protein IWW51_000985 [Coemansia sp. RSA 2702]|nr:hypothetical protein IWW54_000219 [Coemansia sp. RSA 2705]KAJ2322146.1 hypothetical protein IWW52_000272 [Coemansia sp. RSA 2704]KAJ2328801.1 hypothetical protein IWW51_000985 [Coemansia sp. RSA 2702]KAJ2370282.1 hypothetical protein H4S01_000477 [Coemansia sp. RSA 2610]KAJ2739715.1 hypothetical protein H4R23_000258 [Coemansia sp. Cherry 401B]
MEAETEVVRAAINLVRFALACNASGKAIKREEIRGPVLDGLATRSFRRVFDLANEFLREDFGLQMVPLPHHEKKLAATEAKDTQASKAVTRWVLQSSLPDEARERLELVQVKDDQAVLGFAAMVLSLVFVNNMSISNEQLVLYVRKLGPPLCVLPAAESRDMESVGYTTDAQMESAAQAAIAFLVRQGYLDKVSSLGASGRQGIGETQSTQQVAEADADPGQEYTWGPQAKVKFKPLDMARFIATVSGQECTSEFIKTIGRACGQDIATAEAA